jgi:tRNA(Leu) C34 or U34 (ribose-2'-O)-methylase TrmL
MGPVGLLGDPGKVDKDVVPGMQEAGQDPHRGGSAADRCCDRVRHRRCGQLEVGGGDLGARGGGHRFDQIGVGRLGPGVATPVGDQQRDRGGVVGIGCGHHATVRCAAVTDNAQPLPEPAHGLGPHSQPWPEDSRLDPELLAAGDRRNVIDRYRYWRLEAIAAELERSSFGYHVAIENWKHDLNIGTVVRNANAFGAAGVHIVGRRRWNRRGAMVTDRYLRVHHHDSVGTLARWAEGEGLPLVGIDNLPGSTPLELDPLPRDCVLLFGQEGPGLSPEAHERCEQVRSITMYGSTRSINAGVASGIAMNAWLSRHGPR